MTDLIQLAKQGPQPGRLRGPRCAVGVAIADMAPEYRQAVYTMLNDERWEGEALAAVLSTEATKLLGRAVKIGGYTLQRHRRRVCKCDQSERDEAL